MIEKSNKFIITVNVTDRTHHLNINRLKLDF